MSQFHTEERFCLGFLRAYCPVADIDWNITRNKISINFYFNGENVNVEILTDILNEVVRRSDILLNNGWTPNFSMIAGNSDRNNFSKKIILFLEKPNQNAFVSRF